MGRRPRRSERRRADVGEAGRCRGQIRRATVKPPRHREATTAGPLHAAADGRSSGHAQPQPYPRCPASSKRRSRRARTTGATRRRPTPNARSGQHTLPPPPPTTALLPPSNRTEVPADRSPSQQKPPAPRSNSQPPPQSAPTPPPPRLPYPRKQQGGDSRGPCCPQPRPANGRRRQTRPDLDAKDAAPQPPHVGKELERRHPLPSRGTAATAPPGPAAA
nr:vegetative cell wall protein gp1-like [Aegilops tauschii subsp. strangulata]